MRRIKLHLLTERMHIDANVFVSILVSGAPGFPQEILCGHDPVSMPGQSRQQLEFSSSKTDLGVSAQQAPGAEVQDVFAE